MVVVTNCYQYVLLQYLNVDIKNKARKYVHVHVNSYDDGHNQICHTMFISFLFVLVPYDTYRTKLIIDIFYSCTLYYTS